MRQLLYVCGLRKRADIANQLRVRRQIEMFFNRAIVSALHPSAVAHTLNAARFYND